MLQLQNKKHLDPKPSFGHLKNEICYIYCITIIQFYYQKAYSFLKNLYLIKHLSNSYLYLLPDFFDFPKKKVLNFIEVMCLHLFLPYTYILKYFRLTQNEHVKKIPEHTELCEISCWHDARTISFCIAVVCHASIAQTCGYKTRFLCEKFDDHLVLGNESFVAYKN